MGYLGTKNFNLLNVSEFSSMNFSGNEIEDKVEFTWMNQMDDTEVELSVCLSLDLSISLSPSLSLYPSIYPSVYLSM